MRKTGGQKIIEDIATNMVTGTRVGSWEGMMRSGLIPGLF